MAQACQVQNAATDAEEKHLSKRFGIKGVPLLSTLSALSFPASFPYDFMHVVWENLIPNLVLLWTGQFKGFSADDDCRLAKPVWETIGEACATSKHTIPSHIWCTNAQHRFREVSVQCRELVLLVTLSCTITSALSLSK
jgi:hypothetical protein